MIAGATTPIFGRCVSKLCILVNWGLVSGASYPNVRKQDWEYAPHNYVAISFIFSQKLPVSGQVGLFLSASNRFRPLHGEERF